MRLNFSGVDEERIREGIRRLGEVVREQVALYGTLTGIAPAPARPRPVEETPAELAKVLRLPAQRSRAR
jgi:2-aminoadipate transaminase